MGFLEFLQSVASGQTPSNPLARRVAQQAVDAQHPTLMGRDVSGIPVLSGAIRPAVEALNTAGLIGEGAQRVAEATTGAGLAGLGLANRAGLLGMTRANQGELAQLLGGTSGNPLERAMQVNQRAQATVPGMGLVTAAVNPLNLTGPVGEAGAGLRAAEGAPAALRALGTALEGASAVGRAGMLPYEGAFGALGGLFKGVKNAVAPAASEAAPALAAATDSGAAALPAALAPAAPAAPAFPKATLSLLATKGIDPAKLAGLDADLAQYVAENAGPGQEDALIAALRGEAPATTPAAALTAAETPAPAAAPPAGPPSLAGVAPETGTPGPDWTHYGPETIYPGEGVTPGLLDRFAKLRQFPNPSPLDVNAEIGAMRDPVTLLQQTYGDQWQNRLAALTGGKWGQPGSGATLINGRVMLGDLDLTAALRDYLENRSGPQAQDFKGALKGLLPEQGLPTPAEAAPSLSAPPAAPAGTLDDVRGLILDHAQQFNTRYPPLDPAFYAKRANVDPAQVPAMLDQLVQEGTLGRLPDGSLAVKPGAGAALADTAHEITAQTPLSNVDIPAEPAAATPDVADQAVADTPLEVVFGKSTTRKLGRTTSQREITVTLQRQGQEDWLNPRLQLRSVGAGKDALWDVVERTGTGLRDELTIARNMSAKDARAYAAHILQTKHVGEVASPREIQLQAQIDQASKATQALPSGSPERAQAHQTFSTLMDQQRDLQIARMQAKDARIAEWQKLTLQESPTPAPTGGDLAAGGDGFGLLPPRLGSTLAGAGVGTGVGGLAGGGLGLATGHRGDQLRQDIAAGAGLGALAGGSVGSVAPDLPPGLASGLVPGLRTNLLDPLAAVGKEGAAAMRQAVATGTKNPFPSLAGALPYIRSIKKTSAMTTPRNLIGALTTTAIGEGNVPEAAANMRDIWRNLPTLLPALRAAGDDAAARDQALLAALPPRMQAYDAAGMRDLIEQAGVSYERNPTDLGAANVHPLAGAARGAALGLATPKTLVFGPATALLGFYEGATLPGRAAAQTALLTPIDQGARMAFAFPEYARALGAAEPGFLARVKAAGQDIAPLVSGGRFGATEIADPALAAEWRATQQAAAQAGGALAKDRLGNFSDPGVATNFINNFFPGGSWNVEQTKVLAKAAARHPQLAIGLLYTIEQDYQRHLQAGDPRHAGTWRLSDRTPGFGGLVRLANGGAAGNLYLNPAYPVSPVGADVLNLPRELSPQLNPGQSVYDKGRALAGALGLGVNPEIDYAAYKTGQSSVAPSSQLRLAPVGALADALLHRAGLPLYANPLGQAMMPDAAQTPDLQQQIQYNRFLDPAAIRAGNELIYERTGSTSSDPKNADLVAQLRDPSSAFYREALLRGLGGQAATAALGNVVPGAPQAETATAHAGAAARMGLLGQGLPITREQFQAIAARPDAGVVLSQLRQAQVDAAKLANPVLAVQDVGTAKALGEKAFQQWERDNGGLAGFPIVYNILAQREQERLGLVPLGTAMAQQQAYDQLQAGQAYGRPQPYPGVPPLPFDPQPLNDLYRLFGGGR